MAALEAWSWGERGGHTCPGRPVEQAGQWGRPGSIHIVPSRTLSLFRIP